MDRAFEAMIELVGGPRCGERAVIFDAPGLDELFVALDDGTAAQDERLRVKRPMLRYARTDRTIEGEDGKTRHVYALMPAIGR